MFDLRVNPALTTRGLYMKYIIVFMTLFIIFIVIGLFYRKKIYQDVDRLEALKIDIMNRPITEELARVKNLNMTGQTEELFERWRNEWDDLVTNDLPHIEELLFDVEDYADKYRFKKAKVIVEQIETIIEEIEGKIRTILDELQELIGSEEQNRSDIEEQKAIFRELKKSLLAHIHNFDKAEKSLEQHLDTVDKKFSEFNELTNSGNYLQARETVLFIKANLHDIEEKMEKIPHLLIECEINIPSQLEEIKQGYNEMKSKEYLLDHIPLDREVNEIRQNLKEILQLLMNADVKKAEEKLTIVQDKIETLYDLLEQEVLAQRYVRNEVEKIDEILFSLSEEARQTNADTSYVQQSYHLNEQHIEKYRQIEKQVQHLLNRFSIINLKISEKSSAYSLIKEELEDIVEQIQTVRNHHNDFRDFLLALRSDELKARETINEMRLTLLNTKRLINKSNIPGVPESYSVMIQDAKQSLESIKIKLEEKPLDMDAINDLLTSTVEMVNHAYERTNEMINQALLVEKVIQYGNRYRSHYVKLARKLTEAEQAFRKFDYTTALEEAATALEKVDPNAIKNIETQLHEHHNYE